MPTNGDPKLTNQLGIKGVNLKNIMYQNKLFSFAFIIELNFSNNAGNLLKTSYFAKVQLRKKHKLAPKHEHLNLNKKITVNDKKNPNTGP